MAAHSIKTVQKIPVSLDKAWDFFSNPANLQAITPEKWVLKSFPNIMAIQCMPDRSLNTR